MNGSYHGTCHLKSAVHYNCYYSAAILQSSTIYTCAALLSYNYSLRVHTHTRHLVCGEKGGRQVVRTWPGTLWCIESVRCAL